MATKKTPAGPEQVRDLKPNDKNPRRITEARSTALAKSMSKFGDLSGVVFNRRTEHLICGHQRIKHLAANAKIRKQPASDEHGTVAIGTIVSGARASWAYREVDVDEDTEKAMMIAANNQGGDNDDVLLKGLVLDLDQAGFELDLLGLRNLEDILKEKAEKDDEVDDAPGPSGPPRAHRGEVWVCGSHRVMCGDSTSKEDVDRLVGREAAALVFTDPPYGVSYEARGGDFDVIEGDRKRDDELLALVGAALKQAHRVTSEEAAFYVWHASSTRRDFDDALRDAGLVERQYLIWVKNSIVLGHADYRWAHEPCYYASKDGKKPAFYGDRAQPTVWRATLKKRDGAATTLGQALLVTDGRGGQVALAPRLAKGKKSRTARLAVGQTIRVETASNSATVLEVGRDQDHYVHPTQKPVELARIAIQNSSRPGEIVLDLFGGSGTTMIAAELTGRRARLMEIDPRYVDAMVMRWEQITGRTAVKEE